MNKVILLGRLTADPEVRTTEKGNPVATYRLAVDRGIKKEGQPEADFINCVAFENNADFAGKYLHKGIKIAIEGKIRTRTYDDKDGKKVYVTEIIVDRHEFCESKAASNGTAYQAPAPIPMPTQAQATAPFTASAPADDYEQIITSDEDLPF